MRPTTDIQNQPLKFDWLRYYTAEADETDCTLHTSFNISSNGPYGSDFGDQSINWLCVDFDDDVNTAEEVVSWMDHHEFTGTDGGVSPSIFAGPYGEGQEQELRADGYTPLGGAITGAYNYLSWTIGQDANADCRPYSLLVLSDGNPELPGDCDDPNVVTAVNNLKGINVKTWVIGLAFDSKKLNDMAEAGGTGRTVAFRADSEAELSDFLYTIISESLLQETCNYLDDDCDGLTDEDFRPDQTWCDPSAYTYTNTLNRRLLVKDSGRRKNDRGHRGGLSTF